MSETTDKQSDLATTTRLSCHINHYLK